MRLAELDKKPALEGEDLSFALAPRLNAAGRLGQAQLAVELLTTTHQERAIALAEYLNELNSSRQSLERSVYLSALKQAQEQFDVDGDAALVLADHGWHAGVIGIVAGRLAEKFHRPVLVISLDPTGVKPGVGSGRSVPGFDLHRALSACAEHLLSFGGHAAAAGLKVEERNLGILREAFCEYASGEITQADRTAELWIDAELPFSALTLDTMQQIERLAPFGHANHRPLFWATGVNLLEPPKRMGSTGRHLSLKLAQCGVALRGVAFGGGDWSDELGPSVGQPGRGIPSGHQQLSRPPHGRIARGRLARRRAGTGRQRVGILGCHRLELDPGWEILMADACCGIDRRPTAHGAQASAIARHP